jgi:hypothetical protein
MTTCSNCGAQTKPMRQNLCTPCYIYRRKTGRDRDAILQQRLRNRRNAQAGKFIPIGPGRYEWDRTGPEDYRA